MAVSAYSYVLQSLNNISFSFGQYWLTINMHKVVEKVTYQDDNGVGGGGGGGGGAAKAFPFRMTKQEREMLDPNYKNKAPKRKVLYAIKV